MTVVFARKVDGALTSLVKKLNEKAANSELKPFLVVLGEGEETETKLKDLAKAEKIEIPLTVFEGEAGPGNWKVAKEADLTVITYVKRKVAANHAFGEGEFKEEKVESILKDIDTAIAPQPEGQAAEKKAAEGSEKKTDAKAQESSARKAG